MDLFLKMGLLLTQINMVSKFLGTTSPRTLSSGTKSYFYYPLANKVAKGYSNATVRPSFHNIFCEHSRINILQWILTKLGTCLVLKRIWNPINFQGQRSRSPGQIFRRGDTPRFVLLLLLFKLE